ncbi:hypothetical protein Kpol_530p36 [Vanderwaltozyma polyspora DSM 70294]|uniref:Heme oxygenase n=1 Tax=Vanderwaltozyma polyspora (strain ATCC 22028 / DSM 70294 / BCRC 21397 / CBS 2163 / NBRC 10782 / NRRL Y-8283 / UCD 57-17) TaxID=436907 RepID=A7TL10_VANPO|nr:uncharacterized protein Kpol_530p36 [Vanderwaltozyma polyspora DSM 70294]EDO17066.1 hypothetical protein Kpol_530p36 [Vanderwaltozyma polyspora DSM 70294]
MTSTIPSPTDVGALANRINFETRDFHNKVSAFMGIRLALALKHGFIYREGLVVFYHIFNTIETEIDLVLNNQDDSQMKLILSSFYLDEFRRKDKILKDLELLYYPEFQNDRPQLLEFINSDRFTNDSEQLQNFVKYIQTNATEDPCTLLAYCHVLYLALFAGGKIMKSNVTKHLGIFPKFEHLSHKEIIARGTNFYQFTDSTNPETTDVKLRWLYKKNYELSTRDELLEQQKLTVIKTSKDVFVMLENCIAEVGTRNRNELMNIFSYKLFTFIVEEWKYNSSISPFLKKSLMFILIIIQFTLASVLLNRYI